MIVYRLRFPKTKKYVQLEDGTYEWQIFDEPSWFVSQGDRTGIYWTEESAKNAIPQSQRHYWNKGQGTPEIVKFTLEEINE